MELEKICWLGQERLKRAYQRYIFIILISRYFQCKNVSWAQDSPSTCCTFEHTRGAWNCSMDMTLLGAKTSKDTAALCHWWSSTHVTHHAEIVIFSKSRKGILSRIVPTNLHKVRLLALFFLEKCGFLPCRITLLASD